MNTQEKKYIGSYKVIKFYKSGRKEIIERGLTIEQAQRLTKNYKRTKSSFVGFDKQFSAEKYFI
jgi:hypothetical protein